MGLCVPDNRTLDAATIDRLRPGAYRIVIEGESLRKPEPTPENGENAVAKSGKKTHSWGPSKSRFGPFQVASLRRSFPARLRRSMTASTASD